MPLLPRLLAVFALSLSMILPSTTFAAPSMVYLVRHGEKTPEEKDPARQTAQPLAQARGLPVQEYDPRAPRALVEKVKGLNGPVLVIGHSNTLSELVRLFGGQPGPEIADNEYDRVYQLIPHADGSAATVLFTSLPATGPAP
jgi:hypothetical protein